jgi:hypothetical protein
MSAACHDFRRDLFKLGACTAQQNYFGTSACQRAGGRRSNPATGAGHERSSIVEPQWWGDVCWPTHYYSPRFILPFSLQAPRLGLQTQRLLDNAGVLKTHEGLETLTLSVRDILKAVTINGAKALAGARPAGCSLRT